jgi:hypothetical protein
MMVPVMDTGKWAPRQTASLMNTPVVQPPDIHIIPPEIAEGINGNSPAVTTGVGSGGTPPASGAMGATKGGTFPDLVIVKEAAAGSPLMPILLLGGLAVGGWFLYKRFAK